MPDEAISSKHACIYPFVVICTPGWRLLRAKIALAMTSCGVSLLESVLSERSNLLATCSQSSIPRRVHSWLEIASGKDRPRNDKLRGVIARPADYAGRGNLFATCLQSSIPRRVHSLLEIASGKDRPRNGKRIGAVLWMGFSIE